MRRVLILPVLLGLSLLVIILGSLLLPTGLPAVTAQGLGETETLTVTETATVTETVTATLAVTETTIPRPTPTVTETALISAMASPTATPTATLTSAPTDTATVTPTATEAASPTVTPTIVHQQFLPVVMQRWDLGFQPGWRCWGDSNRLDYCGRGLLAIAAVSTADVWTVGVEGAILHWNGSVWRLVDSPVQTDLAGVAAASTDDAWAVGTGGAILHWNGERWNKVSSPTNVNLLGVAVLSPTDAWAIGDQSTILHWNGSFWQSVPCPTDLPLRSLTIQSATNGWIAGGLNDTGVMLHWDGQAWTKAPMPTSTYQLNAMAMISDSDGWAVGGYTISGRRDTVYRIMLRWNGQAWAVFDRTVDCCSGIPTGIAMASATDGWTNDPTHGTLLHWDGATWTTWSYGFAPSFFAVISASDIWGGLAHWDGHAWTLAPGVEANPPGYTALSMTSATDGWAVGYRMGTVHYEDSTMAHWDGHSWTKVASPEDMALSRVAMLSATEGWAAGQHDETAVMLHWNGSAWTPVELPDAQQIGIQAIAVNSPSDAWAVGARASNAGPPSWGLNTLILHWDGDAWREVDSPPNGNLLSISMIGPDDGWAVGFQVVGFQTPDAHDMGLILHWDGHRWTQVPSPVNMSLRAVDMLSASDGWMSSYDWLSQSEVVSRMLHWDGVTWTVMPSPGDVLVDRISMVSAHDGWAGGSVAGTGSGLLHWDGTSWRRLVSAYPVGSLSMLSANDGWMIGGGGFRRYAGSPDQLP